LLSLGWDRARCAGCAASVNAIDAAPEMIALVRQQVTARNVTFVAADILTWAPPRRFDTVFCLLALARARIRRSAASGACCTPR
jgi:2-polyprenyl-3-methyl-5-hydroxy-6-metoxy-1,4-benzoquinol methylase